MEEFIMSEKQRKPWYLNNPELFMTMLLIGCFLVGGSIAFTLSNLTASCLITVAVGGVGGYLWLIKKSEEY